VWRVEHGDQWDRAYTVRLRASPGYSLVSDIVVPLAVDPKDGRILLSTGRRVVFYDLGTETVEELYAADEMLRSDDTARTGVIPMLYEESLVMYPRVISDRCMR
jgi:hypothetical protein